MVLSTKRHARLQFDEDLERVLNLMKSMSELVEKQLREAVELFRIEDKSKVADLAQTIISNDKKVNQFEVRINDACLFLIAKHQPKANDLRLVFALIRAASEFERIGDTVTKISEVASRCEHVINNLIESIEHFAEHTFTQLHRSIECFINMDLKYATEIYFEDDYRTEYKAVFNQITEEAKHNTQYIKEYFRAVIALRQIERIGDRCRNINEFVYFYVKGYTPESKDLLESYKELHKDLDSKAE